MNGAIMGMTKDEITRKFDEIIDFAGVEKYVDTPVKRYSSGMMVRLGFAIAAHLEPEILVVDEVLAVGDAEFQKKAIGKMQDVSRGEGRTVLFVSHNMAAVKSLCTRGIIIKNGLIDYIGDINSTVERYLTDSDFSNNTRIIDNIKWVKSTLRITHVSINGTDSSFSTIRSGQRTLEVNIKGYTNEEMIYDAMIIIKSKEGVPFATYSPGHYFGDIRHQPSGKFEIVREIELPPIMSEGQLLVDLYLHHPMVEYLVKAPNCCILESQGYQSGFGHALNTGYGFIGLKDISRKTT